MSEFLGTNILQWNRDRTVADRSVPRNRFVEN